MNLKRTKRLRGTRMTAAALSVLTLSGLIAAPVRAHADPPTDKGKQGKGKGDGSTIPIKVGPPIITKDPKTPPPSPKKKDG